MIITDYYWHAMYLLKFKLAFSSWSGTRIAGKLCSLTSIFVSNTLPSNLFRALYY